MRGIGDSRTEGERVCTVAQGEEATLSSTVLDLRAILPDTIAEVGKRIVPRQIAVRNVKTAQLTANVTDEHS